MWNDSTFAKIHNPLARPSECSLASVLLASTSHDGDGLAFQEEGTATCTEGGLRGQVEDNSIDHSDMPLRRLHLCRYGWQFSICVTTTVLLCSTSTLAQNKNIDAPDCANSTVDVTSLVVCATGPEPALRVFVRTTALLS